jgi:hypothetical protein
VTTPKKQSVPKKAATKPGPKAARLKLDGTWERAAGKAVRLAKPPDGWPKR